MTDRRMVQLAAVVTVCVAAAGLVAYGIALGDWR
jgi:phage shock protein PspC (stress-responsive transcriptional regulator)